MLDGSDFPKQGRKSAGVARQYCGRLGKVANCQAGMFLAYISPLGRALVDKGLYLPKSWTSDPGRCAAAGVPEERRQCRSKTGLALELLERALERGHLRAGRVAGDDAFGMSPSFREALAALGMRYVLDVPGAPRCGLWSWLGPVRNIRAFGRPRKPRLRDGQRRTMEQGGDELPDAAWREITVAELKPGSPQLPVQRPAGAAQPASGSPVEIHWGIYRAGTWTAASPATTCPTLPGTLPWRRWPTWAVPGGASRRIEERRGAGRVRDPHLAGLAPPTWPYA